MINSIPASWFRWFLPLLVLSICCGTISAQRLESNRLETLLARRGWIRILLTNSTQNANFRIPSGGTISADGKEVQCIAGPIMAITSSGGVNIALPGQVNITARDIVIAPSAGHFSYKGSTYRGRIRLISRSGAIRVVNEVVIEDWLKGVLPAEIGKDAPLEALKAQAVAGRSEAIFRLAKPPHESDGYDFCTGVHCQAYKGMSVETPEVIRACEETLGYVLVANNDVVNAVYHNVCGGATAASEDVWDGGPVPGLTPILDVGRSSKPSLQSEAAAAAFINSSSRDSFCHPENPNYANYAKKYFRWTKTLSASEAGRAAGVGTLKDIRVIERRPSGRVRKLQVIGTAGSKIIEKELPIRRVFDLWSGLFVISTEGAPGQIRSVTFTGAGNGHGVGLCQHGAREIARRGGRFDQILGHYYPTATLRKVYNP